MYSGIKKKVPENMEDAMALLKIMAKSSDLPKTDYNARKDEVKGILDDLIKHMGEAIVL